MTLFVEQPLALAGSSKYLKRQGALMVLSFNQPASWLIESLSCNASLGYFMITYLLEY